MTQGANIAMTVRDSIELALDRSPISDACDPAAAAPWQQIHGLEFSNTASPLEFYFTNSKDTESGGSWTTWIGLPTVRPRNWLYGKLYFEPASSKNAHLACNTEPMTATRKF